MISRLAAICALLLAFCVSAVAGPILNGGFESGSFSDWSLTGNTGGTGVCADGSSFLGSPCVANSGQYAAALGPFGTPGYLSQTIATAPGGLYSLTFFLRVDNLGQTPNNEFSVTFGGTNVFTMTNALTSGYSEITFSNLRAPAASTTLQFTVRNNPGGFFLDDISVSEIPEPGTAFLLAGGLLLLGTLRRRRA